MTAPARVLLAAALVALAVAGCKGRGEGASCDSVGSKFIALARADLDASDLDPASRRGVTGLLAPMRDAMVRACREDKWSAPARTCFAGAADVATFRTCEAELGATQRELLHKAAGQGIHATP